MFVEALSGAWLVLVLDLVVPKTVYIRSEGTGLGGVGLVLPSNGRYVSQEYDYHVCNDEVKVLLRYVRDRYSAKMYLLLCLVWSRGMRVSEALHVNFRDFPLRRHGDFSRLDFREAKTNKLRTNEIVVGPVADLIKEYILSNPLILSHYEGYLFHRRNGKRVRGHPVMSTETAGAFMKKWREGLVKAGHTGFGDRYVHRNWHCSACRQTMSEKQKAGWLGLACPLCGRTLEERERVNYRAGWHSLRRNFEDNGLDYSGDNTWFIKSLMGYRDIRVIESYASKKRQRAKIPDFFDNCIMPTFNGFERYDESQTSLQSFCEESR